MHSIDSLRLWIVVLPLLMLSACSGAKGDDGKQSATDSDCVRYRDSGYEALYTAKAFSSESIGPDAEAIPMEVRSLRCMSQEPDAVEWLRELVRRGTMPGQLYALVGMRALDQAEFKRIIHQYKSNNERVRMAGGDIAISHPVAMLATGIEQGIYVKEFLPMLRHLVPELEAGSEIIVPESAKLEPMDR